MEKQKKQDTRFFRTRGKYGEKNILWREVDGPEWDRTGELVREILYLGPGRGIVLVVREN